MEVPILDLKKQYLDLKEEIDSAIGRVLESGYFILGKEVKKFEKNIQEYLQNGYDCIGVASGSDALLLSLMALNIKRGDEIITTPFSFFATVGCISRLSAKPVFVDINDNFNLDVNKIESKITDKTKAIIIVDLYGDPSDQLKLKEICEKHDLFLIDDACQAIGSLIDDKKIGNIADFTCFSFFSTKNLGAYGDAGLVVVKDNDMAKKIRILRKHGATAKYVHDHVGINSRLDEIQAAILNVKLKHLDSWIEKRIENAEMYSELSSFVKIPKVDDHKKHVFHQYTILADNRNELQKYLKEKGIQSVVYYPVSLHLQKCFSDLGYKEGDFPNAEYASKHVLSLPIHENLKKEQIKYVIDCIKEFYDGG